MIFITCTERDDLGLQMFLNCDYKQVAKDVCERIFDDKFKVIPEESDNRSSSVSDVERNSYLVSPILETSRKYCKNAKRVVLMLILRFDMLLEQRKTIFNFRQI